MSGTYLGGYETLGLQFVCDLDFQAMGRRIEHHQYVRCTNMSIAKAPSPLISRRHKAQDTVDRSKLSGGELPAHLDQGHHGLRLSVIGRPTSQIGILLAIGSALDILMVLTKKTLASGNLFVTHALRASARSSFRGILSA